MSDDNIPMVRPGTRVRITIETTIEGYDDGTRYATTPYAERGLRGRFDILFGNHHTIEVPTFIERDSTGTTIDVEVLS